MTKVHVGEMQSFSDDASEESIIESDDDVAEEDDEPSKLGMADAMAKILRKNVPQHKQVILAKGTTDRELQKRKQKEEDSVEKTSIEKKRLWEEMARVKPDPLERDKERALQKIAQRGVVQLFNAVRKQQKILSEQLDEAGPTEAKKSKALGKMTKGKFLDLLKGQSTNVSSEIAQVKTEIKQEPQSDEEDSKKWNILRDDFMMGAKMKDWDKESDSDNSDNNIDSGSDSG